METVYFTGATGFIGSHFIRNHLATGEYDVQAFVRGRSADDCTQRVNENVVAVDADYPTCVALDVGGIVGVPADITRARLGLSEAWLSAARARVQGATFLHFASSLNFEERRKDRIYDHNINGLRHAIDVASALGCARFLYLSTAYTVGVYGGAVPEVLHRPAAFNNPYEETKCEAEHLAVRLCAESGITCLIVRPSVVVGPSASCKTGGSKTGLYGFIREMYRLASHLKRVQTSVTFYANPDAGVNFVPVDYVCEDLFRLFRDPSARGVHHSTVDDNITMKYVMGALTRQLGVSNLELQPLDRYDQDRASAIERLLAKKTAFYTTVTRLTKDFEKASGPRWKIGIDRFERYIEEGLRVEREVGGGLRAQGEAGEGLGAGGGAAEGGQVARPVEGLRFIARKDARPQLEKRAVVTPDGVSLNVYAAGQSGGEAVVFINAVGMPGEFASFLRTSLQPHYHFITWETRGIPSDVADIDATDVGIGAHLADLVSVLDHFGVEKAHLIGWCSGAYIAYQALSTKRVLSLTLVNGMYGFSENTELETPFLRNLRVVLPMVAGSRHHAARYHAAFFARNPGYGMAAEDARRTAAILDATDPDLLHLTSKPFETPDSLYRYGRVITALRRDERPVESGPLGVPCRIFAGLADEAVNCAESRKLGEKHPGARFVPINSMDHFGIYNHPELVQQVLEFLGTAKGGRAAPAVAAAG